MLLLVILILILISPVVEELDKIDKIVKSSPHRSGVFLQKGTAASGVIPAQAGIQSSLFLDPGLRRGDDLEAFT